MENQNSDTIEKRKLETKSAEDMYRGTQMLVEKKAYDDAIQGLEHLLKIHPRFALAHNDLGVLYYNKGNSEKSVEHYRKAVQIEPHNSIFQRNLADFYYIALGKVKDALEIYENLLSENPEDQETLLSLGHICLSQDKFDDAGLFYGHILEIDQTNTEARQGLDLLLQKQQAEDFHDHHKQIDDEVAETATQREIGESQTFPSTVINYVIEVGNQHHTVNIPENELFRIKSIFEEQEYSVMDKRSHAGVFNVFDIGANIGLFALFTHSQYLQCRIYCFEPTPAAHSLLKANVGNIPEIVLFKYGLFNRDMEASINIHLYNTGQNSIKFSGKHYGGSASVQLMDAGTQFDALGLTHLDILKIDTEGCEVEILESMGKRLERVDYILAEYHSERDRRRIDELLGRFHMFGSSAVLPGIGTVKYVNKNLLLHE